MAKEIMHFDIKKLNTIMKRFLSTKKTDPIETRYYYVENNVNFYATTLGSSVEIAFNNKYEFTYDKGNNENFFVLPNKEMEIVDFLAETVEIGTGKNKKVMPTGDKVPYPNVKGLFQKFNPKNFKRIKIDDDFINKLIPIHDAIIDLCKNGDDYAGAFLFVENNKMHIGVNNVEGLESFDYTLEFIGDKFVKTEKFYYDPSYFLSVLKTLKDLKSNKTIMYLNNTEPILFYGQDIDYIYKLAFNRKLVPKGCDNNATKNIRENYEQSSFEI